MTDVALVGDFIELKKFLLKKFSIPNGLIFEQVHIISVPHINLM